MQNDHEILLVGTGNVAYTLGSSLKKQGIDFAITGRNEKQLEFLRKKLDVQTYLLNRQTIQCKLAIICVNDDSIQEIIAQVKGGSKFICHTSGSKSLELLAEVKGGIFYPFQTFSGNRIQSLEKIPVFIEANNEDVEKYLIELALRLKAEVKELNSEVRQVLHLAGVMTNNFTTLLIQEAKSLLQKENISLEVLSPILQETLAKALNYSLEDSLTGPAKRGDIKTIEAHQLFLASNPSLKNVYDAISAHILSNYQKGK